MTIESERGKGTTVRIMLPVVAGDAAAKQEKQVVAEIGTGCGTILVVEDDPLVRNAALMILNMLGYVTREAEDGPSALQILAKDDSIDLLFTDVVMPKGMNGFQLAEEATRHHDGLRVLLTSGYPETELEKSGLSDSKFRLLSKPYSNEALSKAMQALFDE